jgi:hypothetical protein
LTALHEFAPNTLRGLSNDGFPLCGEPILRHHFAGVYFLQGELLESGEVFVGGGHEWASGWIIAWRWRRTVSARWCGPRAEIEMAGDFSEHWRGASGSGRINLFFDVR